jgi:hypothetical protein
MTILSSQRKLKNMEIEVGVLVTLIFGLTQFAVYLYPTVNRMNITLIVAVVVGVLAVTIVDSIEVLTVLLALFTEVFGYVAMTKSVIPAVQSAIKQARQL